MPAFYNNWENERSDAEWALDPSDFPDMSKILRVTDSHGVSWLNIYGVHLWERKRKPSHSYEDAEKRQVWLKFQGFLIKKEDVVDVIEWANHRDVGDRWIDSNIPQGTQVFLGEYGWSGAAQFFECAYHGEEGWKEPGESCPVKVKSIPVGYIEEQSTFDCSMDETFELILPCGEIMRDWKLRWTGVGADFVDSDHRISAFDPSAHTKGDNALLLREDVFQKYLSDRGLTVIWAVSANKESRGNGHSAQSFYGLRFSGAYAMRDDTIYGFLNHEQVCPN
jgi:hypothetical protein